MASEIQQFRSCSDAQPLNSKNHLSPPPKATALRTCSRYAARPRYIWLVFKPRNLASRFGKQDPGVLGSRYVRPRSLSTGNGEVAVVLSLPETNSWHLKMDGWNMIVSLLGMAYFQRPTVSFIKSVYQHQQFERREQKWKNTDEKQTLNWIAKHFECHQFHQCHFIVLELW